MVQNTITTKFLEVVICEPKKKKWHCTASDQLTEFDYTTLYCLRSDFLSILDQYKRVPPHLILYAIYWSGETLLFFFFCSFFKIVGLHSNSVFLKNWSKQHATSFHHFTHKTSSPSKYPNIETTAVFSTTKGINIEFLLPRFPPCCLIPPPDVSWTNFF